MKEYCTRSLLLSALLLLTVLVWLPVGTTAQSELDCECLSISFLDVGQGDAILIQTPDGHDMLIDGGIGNGVLRVLGEQLGWNDRDIDIVLATHPDTDHIGGLPDVFARYGIGTFIETTNVNETPAATALAVAAETEGSRHVYAEAGQLILLGDEVYLQVLAPHGDETHWSSNNASIILRVVYGETAFVLTGDAPQSIENNLVDLYGAQLESNVLKLGHHGSKTSTSNEFLAAVTPQYAVVSAGAGNRYGHPHEEVISRVTERDIEILSTATDGTITFVSDGQTVWTN